MKMRYLEISSMDFHLGLIQEHVKLSKIQVFFAMLFCSLQQFRIDTGMI